jgi:hypothetical protein
MLYLPLQSVSTVQVVCKWVNIWIVFVVLSVTVMLRFRGRRLLWDVQQKQGMWHTNHARAENISKQNVQDVQIAVPWGYVAGRNHHHYPTVCLLSNPYPPPHSFLHTVHYIAFSFCFQYPPISFISPISCFHFPSSAPHQFYLSLRLSFNNSLYKPSSTQHVTNSVNLSPIILYAQCSSPPWLSVILHFWHVHSNRSSPAFSSTTFQNFPSISVLHSKVSSTTQHYTLNVWWLWWWWCWWWWCNKPTNVEITYD